MDGQVRAKHVQTINTKYGDVPVIVCWSRSKQPQSLEHYRKAQAIVDQMPQKPQFTVVGIQLSTPIEHPFLKGTEHWALCPVCHGDLVWTYYTKEEIAQKLQCSIAFDDLLGVHNSTLEMPA